MKCVRNGETDLSKQNYMNKPRQLTLSSSSKTVCVKFYEEQLTIAEDDFIQRIENTNTDYIVIAIKHNKCKKDHWHMIIKKRDRNAQMYCNSILKKFGIFFRPELDDVLLGNRALETAGNVSRYVTYILHKTDEAQKLQKVPYEKSDLITNISNDEVQVILDGYTSKAKKLTVEECQESARRAGEKLEDFEDFLTKLNYKGMSVSLENKLRRCHEVEVKKRMSKGEYVNRLAITIVSDNYYKTIWALAKTFEDKKTVFAKSYDMKDGDKLHVDTEVLIVESTRFSRLEYQSRKMVYIDKIGPWIGEYYICLDIQRLNSPIFDGEGSLVCKVISDQLSIVERCSKQFQENRTNEEWNELRLKYSWFKERFENALAEYDDYKEQKISTGGFEGWD